MNRLRDEEGEDPVAERGIEMLRAIGATPPLPDLKRKVWGAIQQQRLHAAAPRPLRRLRVAATVAGVLCLAGTAGAVLSQRWLKLGSPPAEQPASGPTPGHARPRARAAAPSVQTAVPSVPTSVPTMDGAAPSGITESPPLVTAPPQASVPKAAAIPLPRSFTHPITHPITLATKNAARAGGRAARASAKPEIPADLGAASPRASALERAEVFDAMVALRRDRDPQRAGRLLDGYLDAHPRGALREEALALGIEAADARGDASAARQLARAYQAAYPSGRFGAFARQHATGPTGTPGATGATGATGD